MTICSSHQPCEVDTIIMCVMQMKKIVLREKFGAVNSYFKKERYQINNLSVYLKELEKEGQSNLKANRRRQG